MHVMPPYIGIPNVNVIDAHRTDPYLCIQANRKLFSIGNLRQHYAIDENLEDAASIMAHEIREGRVTPPQALDARLSEMSLAYKVWYGMTLGGRG